MRTIRVHRFGGPEVMQLEEIPDPRPGPGQVLVRIRAAGVNPVDTYIRSGTYARKPNLPYTPGFDGAGDVVSVGNGVGRVSPGDRVYTAGTISGSYAEYALCAESQVHPLAKRMEYTQGAAVGIPYATAYRSLFQRAHALAAETVLVHGASGGVGIAALQLARAAGMKLIGTAGTDRGRQLCFEQGAHHVLDHSKPDYLEEAMRLTHDRGVDVILEMLANVNLNRDLIVLATGGRIVVIGSRGTIEIDPRHTMRTEGAIVGVMLFNASEKEMATIHAGLVAGLENGTLRPIAGQEIPLGEAARAHEAVLEPGAYGKIVLIP